ncbi:MAG: DUF262 domain-containing protein [Burkholderiaceae bacterium]|nr:DUF262 domain-containing protein [Burkholderiaceae bacterium]
MRAENEKIDGLDKNEDASLGDYPIDTLLIRNESRTVFEVVRRIEKGGYIMTPDFQRNFVWDEEKQSKLIQSVLMRIPLPVFYLAEDEEGKLIVVDGLQRLTTFKRFLDNEFNLKLPSKKESLNQNELDKKFFKELSPKFQSRIEDCNLIIYVIDAKVPERARLDIFERVNSGEPLTRQQMRNCLYNGQATRFVKEEAETELFKRVTGDSLKPETMRDRECVNRFCAFYLLPIESYKGDMDEWLANALEKMNKLNNSELKELSNIFQKTLADNYLLFNEQTFRKHASGQINRGVLNISLWDVMTVGLAKYSSAQINYYSNILKENFYKLLENKEFNNSITLGTNSNRNVNYRFQVTKKMFKEIFNA